MLITDGMRKDLFDYLGGESTLFSESDGEELSISIANLDSLLKTHGGTDNIKALLRQLDEVGCRCNTFAELEVAVVRLAGGGPALELKPEWKVELTAAFKRDDGWLLQEDQHEHLSDARVLELVTKCKGLRFAMEAIGNMNSSKLEYPTIDTFMDAMENAAQYVVHVDDGMRQTVIEILAAPGFDLFVESDNLEFTVGEINDLITNCLGASGTRSALMRANFHQKKFMTFQDLVAGIPFQPFPDALQRAHLLEIIHESPVVDDAGIAAISVEHLNELLIFGGGAEGFRAMLALMESKLENLPVQHVGYLMTEFFTVDDPGSDNVSRASSALTPFMDSYTKSHRTKHSQAFPNLLSTRGLLSSKKLNT
jgi:hypothetical protein